MCAVIRLNQKRLLSTPRSDISKRPMRAYNTRKWSRTCTAVNMHGNSRAVSYDASHTTSFTNQNSTFTSQTMAITSLLGLNYTINSLLNCITSVTTVVLFSSHVQMQFNSQPNSIHKVQTRQDSS